MIEGILRWSSCQRSNVICRSSLQHSLSLRQSVSSQLNLMGTLLTAHIQHPSIFHIQDGLQRRALPMPGSPPSRVMLPGTIPPPSTRFSSSSISIDTSGLLIHSRNILQIHRLGIRVGVLPTKHGSSPATLMVIPALLAACDPESAAMRISLKVFHCPQLGHLPIHSALSRPQLLQTYILSFAITIEFVWQRYSFFSLNTKSNHFYIL